MPIYEFICQECKNIFELLTIKEGNLVEIKCSTCDSDNLERVMSKVTVPSGGNPFFFPGSASSARHDRKNYSVSFGQHYPGWFR
jgi:putative FmdB family regulatory protein